MAQHIHTMSKHDISHLFMQQCSQPKAINKTLIIKLMNPKRHDSNVFFYIKRNTENIKFNQDKTHLEKYCMTQ